MTTKDIQRVIDSWRAKANEHWKILDEKGSGGAWHENQAKTIESVLKDFSSVAEIVPRPKEVTVLFMETSDQRGTSEPVGVYSNIAFAMKASEPLTIRWYTKTFVLDAPPVAPRGYTL